MSTNNICFYGEIRKIIPQLSTNTPQQVLSIFTLSIPNDRSEQTLWTHSDQGLHYLPLIHSF